VSGRALLIIAVLIFAAIASQGGGGIVPIGPSGPKTIMIVYETADQTFDMAGMIVSLRHGENAKTLSDAGHSLLVLDKDTKDENKQPHPLLARFAPYTPPELVIADKSATKLISRRPLPKSAAELLEAVR